MYLWYCALYQCVYTRVCVYAILHCTVFILVCTHIYVCSTALYTGVCMLYILMSFYRWMWKRLPSCLTCEMS